MDSEPWAGPPLRTGLALLALVFLPQPRPELPGETSGGPGFVPPGKPGGSTAGQDLPSCILVWVSVSSHHHANAEVGNATPHFKNKERSPSGNLNFRATLLMASWFHSQVVLAMSHLALLGPGPLRGLEN